MIAPTLARQSKAFLSAAIFLAACMGIAESHAQSTFKADIGGIQLGMTPAQARTALKAFDPGLKITEVSGYFTYSDGVSHTLQTPQFLDKLEATQTQSYASSFIVYFSTSVSDPRVISVTRQTGSQTPPTAAQFDASLIAKYGQPTARVQLSDMVWEEPGKPKCTQTLNYKKQLETNISGMARENVLQQLEMRQKNKMNGLPADLTQCGAYLHIGRFNGDPVVRFSATLLDLGAAAKSEMAGSAWVDKLATDAAGKRTSQGQMPKL